MIPMAVRHLRTSTHLKEFHLGTIDGGGDDFLDERLPIFDHLLKVFAEEMIRQPTQSL